MKKLITLTSAVALCLLFWYVVFADIVKKRNYNVQSKIIITYRYDTLYKGVRGTVYHPTVAQTDDTPFITASGDDFSKMNINKIRWCAVSRDLVKIKFRNYKFSPAKYKGLGRGKLQLGDTIYIDGPHTNINGWWVVKDIMGDYYKVNDSVRVTQRNWIDFLQDHNDPSSFALSCNDIIIKKKVPKDTLLVFGEWKN